MAEKGERALIAQCRRGSQSAFEALFHRYERRVFLLALQMVGNREDAFDISQASFAKAFVNLDKFDVNRSLAPWLFRIVRNQCIDLLRKRKETTLRPIEAAEETAHSYDPTVLVQKDEVKKQIWTAMNRLNVQQREVLVLREFHNMSYKEIATVLQIPVGTVMSRLSTARKNLQNLLEEFVP